MYATSVVNQVVQSVRLSLKHSSTVLGLIKNQSSKLDHVLLYINLRSCKAYIWKQELKIN